MELKKNGIKMIKKILAGSDSDIHKSDASTKILPIEQMVADLLKLSDKDWGRYSFSRDPLYAKFTNGQIRDYINKAILCGEKVYQKTVREYKYTDLEELTGQLGFKVSRPDVPNGGSRVIFAQYTEPDNIVIYMDTIAKYNALNKNSRVKKMLGDFDLYNILLAHELFHGIEFLEKDSIYTQTEKIELWKRPFSNRSKIICMGEIAAMEFAKRINGISFSPFLLDTVLIYAYDKEAGTELYRDIIDVTNDKDL